MFMPCALCGLLKEPLFVVPFSISYVCCVCIVLRMNGDNPTSACREFHQFGF